MIGKEIIQERPVTLAEAFHILSKRAKEGELGYEQKQDYDYGQKFCSLKPEKARELVEKLVSLGLTPYQAVMLVDIMPERKEELDLLFAKEKTKPDENLSKQILELLEQYRE
jgi:DNA-directed RNA polymerase subunit F